METKCDVVSVNINTFQKLDKLSMHPNKIHGTVFVKNHVKKQTKV